MARTRPWELDNDLWERVQPLLTLRQVLGAILYVLRAGM